MQVPFRLVQQDKVLGVAGRDCHTEEFLRGKVWDRKSILTDFGSE
jgi:hypothetical protein